jgi:hypothetical protein
MLEPKTDAVPERLGAVRRHRRSRWPVVGAVAASALLSGAALVGTASATTPPAGPLSTVATGLNNPRHLIFRDGKLYVAEAGVGGNGACATDEEGVKACVGRSGDVAVLGVAGSTTRIMKGLSSVAGQGGAGATGPADVTFSGTNPVAIVQDSNNDPKGGNPFGAAGNDLGKLVVGLHGGNGGTLPGPDLARYEALHNPDRGEPTTGPAAGDPPYLSDPYGVVAYRGGFAVVDAAGNDVLFINSHGVISTLAVVPTNNVAVPACLGGQPGDRADIEGIPTSVRIGPDGALYVSELSGVSGSARVLRIVPGQRPTVYASGFDSITDLAFDAQGRLLVLQFVQGGLYCGTGPGSLIQVDKQHNTRTVLAGGLPAPTGLAVNGKRVYMSVNGASAAGGSSGGKVVSLVENN